MARNFTGISMLSIQLIMQISHSKPIKYPKIASTNTQGRSQPHSPGWARVPLSSFFPQISINLFNFPQLYSFSSSICPSGWASRPPGKALATPLRTPQECSQVYEELVGLTYSSQPVEAFVKQSHEQYVICEQFVDFANSKPFVRLVADLCETPPWSHIYAVPLWLLQVGVPLRVLYIRVLWPRLCRYCQDLYYMQ